jgi:Holliday junction resolvase-like predicted endonuclease
VQQPEATAEEWAANHPGKEGMMVIDGRPCLKAGDFDVLAAVPGASGPARVVHHEEVKAGSDRPQTARDQLDNVRDAVAKAARGEAVVHLMIGKTDVTGRFDLASVNGATSKTRGVAEKQFEESLGLTAKDLEALTKDLIRLEQTSRAGAP